MPNQTVASSTSRAHRVSVRRRVAQRCAALASGLSRLAGTGQGSIIGALVAQMIDPALASELSRSMQVTVISGTNGKTTTTRMVAEVLSADRSVATNRTGANLMAGVLGALLRSPDAGCAVLEVDEAVVGWALEAINPDVLVLLNLSRDQLDRLHEVPAVVERWRQAIRSHPPRLIVANADDPLVVHAAEGRSVVWVAAGLSWSADASICCDCGGTVDFPPDGWICRGCGRRRPTCSVSLVDDRVRIGGSSITLGLGMPGRGARANATIALAVADEAGIPADDAIERIRPLSSIEGRAEGFVYGGTELRLHLAKNPAGWCDMLDLIAGDERPVILALNARSQDGRDLSWIWDVDLDRLRGRSVICIGERRADLLVRLAYAEVRARSASSLAEAMAVVGPGSVHVIANYSAFQQIRRTLARVR